ncbi:hypothetical protein [Nocardia paucivorans]|uniref:hypothetical protein n=1 Tax=Nocardia paucivorans TaxID=114259 RepID=UPI0002DD4CB5|nr:hypothetical protein [Nocardia paucivorans]
MNWNKRIRRTHRILALVFTVTLVVTIAALALRGPFWVSYLPLPPLALLLFTGLYLYGLPFVAARSGGRSASTAPTSWTRRLHRLAAAVFTLTVLATFVALALPEPMIWVSFLPLLPLGVLLLSGLYLLVLSYRGARRRTSTVPA